MSWISMLAYNCLLKMADGDSLNLLKETGTKTDCSNKRLSCNICNINLIRTFKWQTALNIFYCNPRMKHIRKVHTCSYTDVTVLTARVPKSVDLLLFA